MQVACRAICTELWHCMLSRPITDVQSGTKARQAQRKIASACMPKRRRAFWAHNQGSDCATVSGGRGGVQRWMVVDAEIGSPEPHDGDGRG